MVGCNHWSTLAASLFALSSIALETRAGTVSAHAVTSIPTISNSPENFDELHTSIRTGLATTTTTSANSADQAPRCSATPATASASPCIIRKYEEVAQAVACCKQIVLRNIAVPGGQTLDLSGLKTGTTVTFAGITVSSS